MDHKRYLRLSIEEAAKGIRAGEGGPFGAVVVRENRILGKGHNTVITSNDPTAHAEVNAIRDACTNVKDHHLTGAVLYSNFEPCPMCLSAIYWADIRNLYFCTGHEIAQKIGFMDSHLYHEITRPAGDREMKSSRILLPEMERLLEEWDGLEEKILY